MFGVDVQKSGTLTWATGRSSGIIEVGRGWRSREDVEEVMRMKMEMEGTDGVICKMGFALRIV